MECMYGNNFFSSRDFGDISQLTNCILDSGATCHMTPQVSDFIPGLLEDTDKYIEVADGNYVMAKQKLQVHTRMYGNNGDPFITTLHNIIFAPDLCNILFLIIMLMNLVHTCLFHKGFLIVYFGDKNKNAMTLTHIAQRKHKILVKTKEKSKSKKVVPRKKVALELLHKKLGHRYTRSLMTGDTINVLAGY